MSDSYDQPTARPVWGVTPDGAAAPAPRAGQEDAPATPAEWASAAAQPPTVDEPQVNPFAGLNPFAAEVPSTDATAGAPTEAAPAAAPAPAVAEVAPEVPGDVPAPTARPAAIELDGAVDTDVADTDRAAALAMPAADEVAEPVAEPVIEPVMEPVAEAVVEPGADGPALENLFGVAATAADPAPGTPASPAADLAAAPAADSAADSAAGSAPPAAPAPRRDDHLLPARVEDDNGADLLSVFDETPPAAPAVAEEEQVVEYANQGEALQAWRDAQEQNRLQREAAAAQHMQAEADAARQAAFRRRFVDGQALQPLVERVLALASVGDAKLQATLRSFELTRDLVLDAANRQAYAAAIMPLIQSTMIPINNPSDLEVILDIAFDELIGIGPLGPLWRDDDVTEILVDGPFNISVERNGALVKSPVKFRDLQHLQSTARTLARSVDDRSMSKQNPLVTTQLPGARVQFAIAPVAPTAGVSMTIRKFRPLFGMKDLLRFGSLTEEMAAFLADTVTARANILVSGGTGSGKTTLINGLSEFIPDDERVITLEDALELKLSNTHVLQMLTKEASSGDDDVRVGQDDLLRATLRMRPDRIIVGEIRDGNGCSVMLQAANTGHDGTMTTVHANGPRLALNRLATLLRMVTNTSDEIARTEVTSAFDVVVQVIRRRGRRFVSHISVVDREAGTTTDLFTGTLDAHDELPVFSRPNRLGSDTELAHRMSDAGLNPDIWF